MSTLSVEVIGNESKNTWTFFIGIGVIKVHLKQTMTYKAANIKSYCTVGDGNNIHDDIITLVGNAKANYHIFKFYQIKSQRYDTVLMN